MEDIKKVRIRMIELTDSEGISLHKLYDTLYKICVGLDISLSEMFDIH